MRFNSVKMVGFKKFLDSTIELGPGLTIFHGPNEAGKSTLHQAVITGLYGLSRKADTNLLKSKEDARSWQNLPDCILELHYSIDEARYLLRRDLTTGKVELFSVDTAGERTLISANAKEVEALIADQTGIETPYVFNRTISVCQADLAEVADLERIGGNIESVFAGAAAVTASDAAVFIDRRIRKPLRKVKNESPGRLDRLTEHLESLIAQIEKAHAEEHRREELADRVEALEQRLPQKESRLAELTRLLEKSAAKKKIEDELEDSRRRFNTLQERIRSIEECTTKLQQLEKDMEDLGAIALFDPDQLDAARTELERNRAELEAQAAACADRIQNMQKKMKSAEELSAEIALIEQRVGEFGKLAGEADLDALDARRRDLAEKLRTAEDHVREQNDKLEHMEHSLWGLEQFANKYPHLGNAWELQSQWQRLELREDEHKRGLERAKADLAEKEDNRPPPTFAIFWVEMLLPLAFLGLLLAALISGNPYLRVPLGGVAGGVAAWWLVRKMKRRSRREQWRADHTRLQGELSATEAQLRRISGEIAEFAGKIAVENEQVAAFIEEYRSNQEDLKSLRREHEQCIKDRDRALITRDEAEKETRRLAEACGCAELQELRDKITELRNLRSEADRLGERLAGVLGLDRVTDPEEMLLSARGNLAEMNDQKRRIEKEQLELARRETEFLHRASCDDILQLGERTKRLRAILANRNKLTAATEAHSGGKTLEELKTEQNNYTLEIKIAISRLDEEFPGFDVTVEQAEFWRKEKDRLQGEVPDLDKSLTEARTQLAMLEERASTPPAELHGEKQFIESEIDRGDFIVTAAQVAIGVLGEVEQQHHDTYVPKLQSESGEHFGRLTGGAYRGVNLEQKWPKGLMAVDGSGRQIDAERLSRGTIDQLYFSLRLALAKALGGGISLPLILDDPFVNFDEQRFEEVLRTIITLVQEGQQIIYFTHSSQLAEREGEWQRQGIDARCVKLGD